MRWVTYYEFLGNISNVTVHANKADAEKFFKAHYKSYFQLNSNVQVKLPMRYGFPFRAYYGVSLLTFKRRMMKQFDMTEKEFTDELKECIDKARE